MLEYAIMNYKPYLSSNSKKKKKNEDPKPHLIIFYQTQPHHNQIFHNSDMIKPRSPRLANLNTTAIQL